MKKIEKNHEKYPRLCYDDSGNVDGKIETKKLLEV